MRTRKEIESDGKRPEFLILEVLLDLRETILKERKVKKQKRIKREEKG